MLFVCTGNSARSPIAEALLRHHAAGSVERDQRRHPARRPACTPTPCGCCATSSASTSPASVRGTSTPLAGRRFDHVITLCDKAREACPELRPRPRRAHWSIPDPATAATPTRPATRAFRRTAADIDTRIRHLLPVLTATDR